MKDMPSCFMIHENKNTLQNLYYTDTFSLFEGVDARAITIQHEQYGAIVYLFIGRDTARVKVHLCP